MPKVKHDPTEVEIAQRTAEIRSQWNEREFRKRACINATPWNPPAIMMVNSGDDRTISFCCFEV
jgi:O-glycosyl hydrolase